LVIYLRQTIEEMGLLATADLIRRRERRRKVLIAIRVRSNGPIAEGSLRDVSPRGVRVQTSAAPPRGTVVELIGPFAPVAARVVWSDGRSFGAELRDRIDVEALTSGKMDRRSRSVALEEGVADRRAKPAAVLCPAQLGRWMQTVAVYLVGAGVAGIMAFITYDSFAGAAASIRAGMNGEMAEAAERGRR